MTTLPDYREALDSVLQAVKQSTETESVTLDAALGRVSAGPIVADRDLPPFNRAQMDGYALRGSEFGTRDEWPVAAVISAGHATQVSVPPGTCVAIATGAPLPDDVDTVIQHEVSDRGDLHGNPVRFSISTIEPGHAVHPRGADAKAGDELIQSNTWLMPHHIGIAVTVGRMSIDVLRQPTVTILTSGDEVVSAVDHVQQHQIRNSNGPMLNALLSRVGALVQACYHLPDEFEPTVAAVGDAVRTVNLLISVGGVSVGERDHFPAAFDEHGIERILYGAAIQPGRPIYVGQARSGCIVVGLPGNPVSALACTTLFVWPIVRAMLGMDAALPWRTVTLNHAVKPNATRRAFRPCIDRGDGSITIPKWAGSGDLAHTSPTTGLVELPVQSEDVPSGASLRYLPWP